SPEEELMPRRDSDFQGNPFGSDTRSYRGGAGWRGYEGIDSGREDRGFRQGGSYRNDWYEGDRDFGSRDFGGRSMYGDAYYGTDFSGRGPKGYMRSDTRIHEEVCDALMADPYVDASDINVKVEGRIVSLSGTVLNRKMKRHAEDCAERVLGVDDVQNELKVKDANLWEKMTGQEAKESKIGASKSSSEKLQ